MDRYLSGIFKPKTPAFQFLCMWTPCINLIQTYTKTYKIYTKKYLQILLKNSFLTYPSNIFYADFGFKSVKFSVACNKKSHFSPDPVLSEKVQLLQLPLLDIFLWGTLFPNTLLGIKHDYNGSSPVKNYRNNIKETAKCLKFPVITRFFSFEGEISDLQVISPIEKIFLCPHLNKGVKNASQAFWLSGGHNLTLTEDPSAQHPPCLPLLEICLHKMPPVLSNISERVNVKFPRALFRRTAGLARLSAEQRRKRRNIDIGLLPHCFAVMVEETSCGHYSNWTEQEAGCKAMEISLRATTAALEMPV